MINLISNCQLHYISKSCFGTRNLERIIPHKDKKSSNNPHGYILVKVEATDDKIPQIHWTARINLEGWYLSTIQRKGNLHLLTVNRLCFPIKIAVWKIYFISDSLANFQMQLAFGLTWVTIPVEDVISFYLFLNKASMPKINQYFHTNYDSSFIMGIMVNCWFISQSSFSWLILISIWPEVTDIKISN